MRNSEFVYPSKALSTLSQKSETVAENGETNGEIRKLSHFAATVWTGY